MPSVILVQAQEPAAAAATAPLVEAPATETTGRGLWASAEYLLWWVKDSPLPVPLVSANPTVLPVLGTPGTAVLIGNDPIDLGAHSGGRFRLGAWLDENGQFGVEGTYGYLASRNAEQFVSGGAEVDAPFIGVPTFSTVSNSEALGPLFPTVASGEPLLQPGVPGAFRLRLSSRLEGAEVSGIWSSGTAGEFRLTLLGGFRYLELHERLTFDGRTSVRIYDFTDQFDTRNQFYGGQVGTRLDWSSGPLVLSASAKLALGRMHQEAAIDGMAFSILGTAGTPFGYLGGIFAQPTNIGKYERDRLAVIPEVEVSLGGRLTSWARGWIGYDFLYLDPVLRPGDQIDRVINPTRTGFLSTLAPAGVMGPLRPGFPGRQTSFWAQGLTFGLELTY
jgi:hypothetical protein